VPPSKLAPRANDVSVHIGAIKLEIHPPPAQGPQQFEQPRREAAPELPRFQPQRHYLRW
jgi:hypothetical protein